MFSPRIFIKSYYKFLLKSKKERKKEKKLSSYKAVIQYIF